MYYNHRLRSNLQEWKNQFYKCDFEDFEDEFLFLYDKLNEEPIVKSILEEVTQEFPINFDELAIWLEQLYYDQTKYINKKHKLAYLIHSYNFFISKEKTPTYFFHSAPKDNNETFLNRFITPIFNFLHESLDNISYVLYILEMYIIIEKGSTFYLKSIPFGKDFQRT